MTEQETTTVWIGKNRSGNIYHTDPECDSCKFTDGLKKVNLRRFSNYRQCKTCKNGSNPPTHEESDTHKDCPFCGENVMHLSMHLPNCDET